MVAGRSKQAGGGSRILLVLERTAGVGTSWEAASGVGGSGCTEKSLLSVRPGVQTSPRKRLRAARGALNTRLRAERHCLTEADLAESTVRIRCSTVSGSETARRPSSVPRFWGLARGVVLGFFDQNEDDRSCALKQTPWGMNGPGAELH